MWACPRCGRTFAGTNQTHTCAPLGDLETHFRGRQPQVRAAFDRVLAYSGDCGPGPEVEVVAAGAGLFLCEAYRALPGEPDPPGTVKTPEQAGHAAARAGARSLLLTHLHPAADPDQARERAAGAFPGPVAVAGPGEGYEVPA